MRSRLFKNVRCKNRCAVSSTGKVGLLFGFNDSIKPLLYYILHLNKLLVRTVCYRLR